MGKQITTRKRAFAKHYAECGDVTKAAIAAGYTGPQGCYRYLKRNKEGVLIDEVFRALMIEYGAPDITPVPDDVVLPKSMKKRAPKVTKKVAEVIRLADVSRPSTEVVFTSGAPSLDDIRAKMWEIANDFNTPAGPRVQALTTLLKDAKDEFIPDEASPDETITKIRLKLGLSQVS